jgi:hypothetical protein
VNSKAIQSIIAAIIVIIFHFYLFLKCFYNKCFKNRSSKPGKFIIIFIIKAIQSKIDSMKSMLSSYPLDL